MRDALHSSGATGARIISYPTEKINCGTLYVPGPPTRTDPDGTIVVSGGSLKVVCSPIVFDLGGDGFSYTSITAPVLTDEGLNGRWEKRAWVSANEGLLIWDGNNNGIAEHDGWVLTNFTDTGQTDLEALRAFDTNKDGVLSVADANFTQFKIGRDLNQNANFEANEVATLGCRLISAQPQPH